MYFWWFKLKDKFNASLHVLLPHCIFSGDWIPSLCVAIKYLKTPVKPLHRLPALSPYTWARKWWSFRRLSNWITTCYQFRLQKDIFLISRWCLICFSQLLLPEKSHLCKNTKLNLKDSSQWRRNFLVMVFNKLQRKIKFSVWHEY